MPAHGVPHPSPELALSGHAIPVQQCPLSGGKRTWSGHAPNVRVECTKCDRKALQRGAATTTEERVIAGKKPMDVTRVRITDAGRRALSGGNG